MNAARNVWGFQRAKQNTKLMREVDLDTPTKFFSLLVLILSVTASWAALSFTRKAYTVRSLKKYASMAFRKNTV